MRSNKTVWSSVAGALVMIAIYVASARVGALISVSSATAASINPLAAARYQEYAGNDPEGEKAITENEFYWRHETWSGDDKPYQQARQQIEAAIVSGKSAMQLADEYQQQAHENTRSPLAQFRWGYALWKTITPTSTWDEKQANGLGVFFAVANAASPNTYDYARLRYLVSYNSQDQTQLGERLLRQESQDVQVKARLALDYTTPGPEPYNSTVKNRAIQLSKELIQSNPKYPRYYAILAEAYLASYSVNGHHRQDAVAVIAALKKYLRLAKPDEYYYQGAKIKLSYMEQRVEAN